MNIGDQVTTDQGQGTVLRELPGMRFLVALDGGGAIVVFQDEE